MLTVAVRAQEFRIKRLGVENGLSSNYATSIAQDN